MNDTLNYNVVEVLPSLVDDAASDVCDILPCAAVYLTLRCVKDYQFDCTDCEYSKHRGYIDGTDRGKLAKPVDAVVLFMCSDYISFTQLRTDSTTPCCMSVELYCDAINES